MPTSIQLLIPTGEVLIFPVRASDNMSAGDLRDLVRPFLKAEALEFFWVLAEGGRRLPMYIDEAAHTKGLPINARATALYRGFMALRYGIENADSFPKIAGSAVLFPDGIEWQ